MKTSELIGPALDYAVAECEGLNVKAISKRKADHIAKWLETPVPPTHDVVSYCNEFYKDKYVGPRGELIAIPGYSTDWSQGGPIIERERIDLETRWNVVACGARSSFKEWRALHPKNYGGLIRYSGYGPTPLIAAMRCLIASRLGDEVEIPEELCK